MQSRLLIKASLIALFISVFVYPNKSFAANCSPEITTNGSYTVVAFKTVGTCTWSTPAGLTVFKGLIVGGGGGGGAHMGGGGGGGGLIEFDSLTATSDVFTITVGDGGDGAPSSSGGPAGYSGNNSTIIGNGINLIARGGAGGASTYTFNIYPATTNGGSGGGSSGANDYPGAYPQDRSSVGTQTSQSQTPLLTTIGGQQFGFNGSAPGARWNPGGGGGAGGSGTNTPATGGSGRANSILGTNYYWAGGGGGSGYSTIGGNGGSGGGGGGGSGNISIGTGGTGGAGINSGGSGAYIGGVGGINTGGGGGAGTYSAYAGGKGGSGIVVLSYSTFIGYTTISLQLSSGGSEAIYRSTSIIEAIVGTAGRVTFFQSGKVIPGCKNRTTSGSSPNIKATCSWKPANRGSVRITAQINPTSASYALTNSAVFGINVSNRSTPR
jgi:fibronectin-binding autotransporter adhesin